MNTSSTQLPDLIRKKRESLGLTQKEFAEFLELKNSGERTISGWERGEHKPSSSKFRSIMALETATPFKRGTGKEKFTFIDLFAGIGGLRIPFQEIGGKCVFTSEWDKFSKKTYAANFGELPSGDITKIPANSIPDHDLLLAGFPCQAFSQAGLRKGFLDTRGTLFFDIQRILIEKRPKIVLLENVKQLRGHDKGKTLSTILSILRGDDNHSIPSKVVLSKLVRNRAEVKLNYCVKYRVLNAANFGVPQKRERIYILAIDRDQATDLDIDRISEKIFKNLDQVEVKNKLGSILEPNNSVDSKYTISDRLLAGHERRKVEHKKKGNGFGYSVFNAQSPHCNTISARYYKDGSEILINQEDINKNPRKLTPRECARIQGFPEKFLVNAVSDCQMYKQFGNSVSVPVIRAIASELKKSKLLSSS